MSYIWFTYIFFTVIKWVPFRMCLFKHKRVSIDLKKLSELTKEVAEVHFAPASQEIKDSSQHDCTSNLSPLEYTFLMIRPNSFSDPFKHIIRWFCTDDIIILMPFPCNTPKEQISLLKVKIKVKYRLLKSFTYFHHLGDVI